MARGPNGMKATRGNGFFSAWLLKSVLRDNQSRSIPMQYSMPSGYLGFQWDNYDVPMDKYTKRNNRSELWARRRNNTAQQLLDKKLRHLEKEWKIEQKQHKRDEHRVKSDLKDLENTDHYPVNTPDRTGSANRETTTPVSIDFETLYSESELKSRPSTGNNKQEKIDVLPETRFRTSALLPSYKPRIQGQELDTAKANPTHWVDSRSSPYSSSVSSVGPPSFHSKLVQASQSPCLGFFTSTPYRSFASPIRGREEPQWKRGNGKRRVRCRFTSLESSTSKACEHFPCKTPLTYHSLGFRREDLVSPVKNFDIEDRPQSGRSATPLFLTRPRGMEKQECKTETSKPYNKSCLETHEAESTEEYPRVNHGPPFQPAPVDTVFEKVRHGVEEKSINSARVHARVGVHDRIRGLRQLVKEMKLRNESVKPPDWAINYGRRVPTRVLLNPVVPV